MPIENFFCLEKETPRHAPLDCYYAPEKRGKKKSVFQTEHEWGTVFRISNKVNFNPILKQRYRYGATILGKIIKKHPNSFRINVKKYHIGEDKKPTPGYPGPGSKTTYSISIKNGHVNLFMCFVGDDGSKKFRNISAKPNIFLNETKIDKKSEKFRFARAVNLFLKRNGLKQRISASKSLRQSLLELCYPLLKDPVFRELNLRNSQYGISPLLRKSTGIRDIVKKIFKCTGRRTIREFLEEIRRQRSLDVMNLYHIRGLAPVETLREILPKDQLLELINPKFRKFLLMFHKERRRSLISRLKISTREEIRDTILMYDRLKRKQENTEIPSRHQTWEEIHDYLAKVINRLEFPNKPIKVYEKSEVLDGLIIDDYKIQIPRDTDTLWDWGGALRNCVGSYSMRAGNENCILLGLIKNGTIEFCIEIMNKRINQFSGKFRASPSEELEKKVSQLLIDHKLIDATSKTKLIPF